MRSETPELNLHIFTITCATWLSHVLPGNHGYPIGKIRALPQGCKELSKMIKLMLSMDLSGTLYQLLELAGLSISIQ